MNDVFELDVSAFQSALSSLKEAILAFEDERHNRFIRDAGIQRFKYSHELAHKMLKRFLAMTSANPDEIIQMSFPALIRTGAEKGLLKSSWDRWSSFRTARNLTSHTYDEVKAIEVFQVIPDFFEEAEFLLGQLQKRIGKP